jgi:predicted AAA+ superfamily ATPase
MFRRIIVKQLTKRLEEPRRFIQVLCGPRQIGKTTIVTQVMKDIAIECHYASADEPMKADAWIDQQWETARFKIKTTKKKVILILDEIQKIPSWSETVKRLWDEDTKEKIPLHVVLLGSSPLLVQQGQTESLAGRFEVINATHWSFNEMREAFGWNIDEYMFYGGYPGSAVLIDEPQRWANYIRDSLIETSITRDILLMTRVDKPALLRRLFELGCHYSGQVLSFQKMIGQLVDAGNTTTLAHYLDLLGGAGLLAGLSKYASHVVRQRASSPKLQVLNTALLSAQLHLTLAQAKQDTELWGRLVESSVGSSLFNAIKGTDIKLFYWTGKNHEVDFVLSSKDKLIAIEVKSGRKKGNLPGIEAFSKEFSVNKKLLVGEKGIPLKEFLSVHPSELF